jgi:hypothetical protein
VIGVELTKVLAVSFIKEVYHRDWLANPVLVSKNDKEWRMCVDYTNLNKRYPCQGFRSGQPTGGLTLVVYLFGGVESRARNSKVAHEHKEHREHDQFILVWASGE